MSTALPPFDGALRRPSISTSVRCCPRPRNEIVDTDEPPTWLPPAPVPATTPCPFDDVAVTCLSSCSVLVTPERWMSSRVSTWTGNAVSASIRLIAEPVTSTRSPRWSGTGVLCASAFPASARDANAPPV